MGWRVVLDHIDESNTWGSLSLGPRTIKLVLEHLLLDSCIRYFYLI